MAQHLSVLLDLSTARQCFTKLRNDFQIKTLIMGNWGEPLLHPRLTEIVGLARAAGFEEIGVSTSLSVTRNMEEIASAGLDFIHVSISGLSAEIYNLSHRQGNLGLVMNNLKRLSSLVAQQNGRPMISLRWHRYLHNEFQLEAAKTLCENLGIMLLPYYGHLGSVEALRDWLEGNLEEPLNSFVSSSVFTGFVTQACHLNRKSANCKQSEFLVIDADGSLVFCCSCYQNYKAPGNFLSMSVDDIIRFKALNSSMCGQCLAEGWAGYMNRAKTLEEYGGSITL